MPTTTDHTFESAIAIVAVLVHPIVGMLVVDEPSANDVADDIGETFDLNEVGTLKSRVTLCW